MNCYILLTYLKQSLAVVAGCVVFLQNNIRLLVNVSFVTRSSDAWIAATSDYQPLISRA